MSFLEKVFKKEPIEILDSENKIKEYMGEEFCFRNCEGRQCLYKNDKQYGPCWDCYYKNKDGDIRGKSEINEVIEDELVLKHPVVKQNKEQPKIAA